MKFLYIFLLSSFLGFILFAYLFFSMNSTFPNVVNFYVAYFLSMLLSNMIGFSVWGLNTLMAKLWNWKQLALLKIVTLLSLFTSLAAFLAKTMFPVFVTLYFTYVQKDALPEINYINLNLQFVILSFNLILIYVLGDYLVFSYKNYIYRKISVVKEQKERSQLQLEMLQKQLSPHYLFNSLNTISSLLETSAQITEKYIRKLVKTYQYILNISNKELVLLADELKMIRAYQFQLEVRFGANIIWEYAIDDGCLKKYVPPLSLQILVENAVKHNVASSCQTLIIKMETKNNHLFVKNNITQAPEKPLSHKIGLKNLQKRYLLLGDYAVKTHKNENFEVQLPLIELN